MDGFGDFCARPNLTHAGHGDPAEQMGLIGAVRMDGFGTFARPNLTHAGHESRSHPAEHNGRTLLRKS